jgi:hypothetical protein
MRRVSSCTDAAKSQAVADAIVCWKSLARRRFRLSLAKVRSTTQWRGESLEAFGGIGSLDDFDGPLAGAGRRGLEFVPGLAAIGEDMAQPRQAPDDFGRPQRGTIAILDIGGMDHDVNQIALGVGKDMALASLDLLAGIAASGPTGFRGFGALAIDDAGTWACRAAMRPGGADFMPETLAVGFGANAAKLDLEAILNQPLAKPA